MRRRDLLKGALPAATLIQGWLQTPLPPPSAPGELLYNGIRLPAEWPPRLPQGIDTAEPAPYVVHPPKVIPVDVGRQLFVDDFLIEDTTLQRVFHPAAYDARSPVLRPDRAWEGDAGRGQSRASRPQPVAMVFSDGVWFDPRDGLFKMWYMSGLRGRTSYAVSEDGVSWTKPALDIVPGTNIVLGLPRDSSTVWLDSYDVNPARRFKMAQFIGGSSGPLRLFDSPDGMHWRLTAQSSPTGDRSTFFYNPFRRQWVYSLRASDESSIRWRAYWETRRFDSAADWGPFGAIPWVSADRWDPAGELRVRPQLYNLDCVAYESVLLGLFTIWQGDPGDRPKLNNVFVGFSRDGFHWTRGASRPLVGVSDRRGAWNFGNVQSAGGCCLIVDDSLRFYVSGRAGLKRSPDSGACSTGLATLRRDGFASMTRQDWPGSRNSGAAPGRLTTRTIEFSGEHLFVNADVPEGELRVEVLTADGGTLAPFTREACVPVRGDTTSRRVEWTHASTLRSVRRRPVRLRFHLTAGHLYSFWISQSTSGASGGYVAAGGPAYKGPIDS